MADDEKTGNCCEQHAPDASATVKVEVQPPEQAEQRGPSREELIEALNKTREEAKALRERMLRVLADVDNQRKRLAREREEIIKFGQEKLMRDLLPVLDNLERSLRHVPADAQDQGLLNLRNGVQLVLNQLLSTLQNYGLKQFSATGKAFDPQYHEAIERVAGTDLPPESVASEIARGYLLHDRLLRPALVAVAAGPAGGNNPQAAEDQNGE